jgi:hypothetical protein
VSIVLNRAKSHIETKIKNGEALTKVESDLRDLIGFEDLSPDQKLDLRDRLKKLTLMSDGQVNPKTAKTLAGYHFENYILHLSPADSSGVNLCPAASKGCKAACLNTAGRGRFDSIQWARLRKTLYFLKLKADFLSHLDREIGKAVKSASKNGVKVTVRLNGTSDLPWESLKVRDGLSLIELYQNVTFYDYTKIFSRLARLKLRPLKNYSLTFSFSESNESESLKALDLGFNVARVFDSIPKDYQGTEVLDGDSHDFRFLDRQDSKGFWIGLKAKGQAKRDASGFVTRLETDAKPKTKAA